MNRIGVKKVTNLLHYLLRLTLRKVTLNRMLTEMALERLMAEFLNNDRSFKMALLAGGSKTRKGSESVVLRFCKVEKVIAIDISPSSRPDVLGDLTHPWPFKDASFELVIATWVLEHLSDPETFWREAWRVLRSSGCIIVTVPFIHQIHAAPYDYWRLTDKAITNLARSAGFEKVQVKPVGGTPFLCAVALLWPVLRLPIIAELAALVAWLADRALLTIARLIKRGAFLYNSYVISWIVLAFREKYEDQISLRT